MNFFDTHSHLILSQKYLNLDDHIKNANNNNLSYILDPGIFVDDFIERKKLLSSFEGVYLGIAIAPHEVKKANLNHKKKLSAFLSKYSYKNIHLNQKKSYSNAFILALSEIGLDYYYFEETKKKQRDFFLSQLELAKNFNLPFFVHMRDSFEDILSCIKEVGYTWGAIHCFTGNTEQAKKLLDLGLYLSFSGIVTFKKAVEIQEALKYTPNHKILTETDSPYLTPDPLRGKPNQSAYIKYTHNFIANLKNTSIENLNKNLFNNAIIFFKNRINLDLTLSKIST